jgi:hypothetical protein
MRASRVESEPAAALGVEHGGEDAGGVEVGKAEPVDGSIQRDQRDRAAVTYDRIVAERMIAQLIPRFGSIRYFSPVACLE